MILALTLAVLVPAASALDSLPPAYLDVLDADHFFRSKTRDLDVRFGEGRQAVIGGVAALLPELVGMEMGVTTRDGNGYVRVAKDGTELFVCAFLHRNPQPQDEGGEPFASMKKVIQVELLKNIIIRGAANDCGDRENFLPHLPVIVMAENTARSLILEGRNAEYDRELTPPGTAEAVFEGCVLLGRYGVTLSAIAHPNPHGIDAGAVFLAWFDRLVRTNGGRN